LRSAHLSSRGTDRSRGTRSLLAFGDVLLESFARLLRQQQPHVVAERVTPDVPARTLHRRRQVRVHHLRVAADNRRKRIRC